MADAARRPDPPAEIAHRVRLESLVDAMNAAIRDAYEDGWQVQIFVHDLGDRITAGQSYQLLVLESVAQRPE